MHLNRREFLQTGTGAALAGAATMAVPLKAAPARLPQAYFGLHPFIEANPKAVFIRRTNVPHKMHEESKLREGLTLAREIFVPLEQPGVPVSHRIVLKPNVCSVRSKDRPHVENWGTGTDPQFYEGMVMGLKELGLKKFHFVEANNFHHWNSPRVRGHQRAARHRDERAGAPDPEFPGRLRHDVEQGARRRGLHAASRTTRP